MIWEVGQDVHPSKKKSLLKAISDIVRPVVDEDKYEL